MAECSNALRRTGEPSPRTCAVCGLGPCRYAPWARWYTDAPDIAVKIAAQIFPHSADRQRRDELTVLLAAFAAEIKRSAIEP